MDNPNDLSSRIEILREIRRESEEYGPRLIEAMRSENLKWTISIAVTASLKPVRTIRNTSGTFITRASTREEEDNFARRLNTPYGL